MLTVTVDPKDYQKWMNENVVVLKDAQGKVLGTFYSQPQDLFFEQEMTDEEVKSALHEGGGRSLNEILADLEHQK